MSSDYQKRLETLSKLNKLASSTAETLVDAYDALQRLNETVSGFKADGDTDRQFKQELESIAEEFCQNNDFENLKKNVNALNEEVIDRIIETL